MLDLFKPLKMLLNSQPIIFTELGDYILNKENKFFRPFIIFYDDSENCYYYLKARDAKNNDGSYKREFNEIDPNSKNFSGEILIKGTKQKYSLLEKDSLIDCSQIFKMDADLLESLIDKKHISYIKTKQLDTDNINLVLNGVKACMFQIPPYLSIIQVDLNADDYRFLEAESLYLCPKKYEYAKWLLNNDIYDIPKNKTIQDFSITNKKLNYAYHFCTMFLNKYFPDKLEDFELIQSNNQKNNFKNMNDDENEGNSFTPSR